MDKHLGWLPNMSPLVAFQHLLGPPLSPLCNVIVHPTNVNVTGKKRPGCKEGHRRNGSAGDQVRRHGLLHHARGNGTLAVVPGARCQIVTLRTSEEKGELPLPCTIEQQAKANSYSGSLRHLTSTLSKCVYSKLMDVCGNSPLLS